MSKNPTKINPLSKLYTARQKSLSEFAGLPQRVQTVLVNHTYTKASICRAIQSHEFDPKLISMLGSRGFEELLKWVDYK